MIREFCRRYLFRVLILLPFIVVVGFIPPYPIEAKLFGLFVALIAMLIVQLVEVLIYLRARGTGTHHGFEELEKHGDSWSGDSRKARRRRAHFENPDEN